MDIQYFSRSRQTTVPLKELKADELCQAVNDPTIWDIQNVKFVRLDLHTKLVMIQEAIKAEVCRRLIFLGQMTE